MGDRYDFPGYGERSPFFSPRGSGRAAGWKTVMTILDTESVPPLPLPVGERKDGRIGDSYDFPGYGEHSPFLSPWGSGRTAGWETVMTFLDTESVPPSSPRGGGEERQDGRQL